MTAALGTRPPRWRCAEPRCPAHRWQRVDAYGEFDPVDVALEALERHWRDHHHETQDRKEKA